MLMYGVYAALARSFFSQPSLKEGCPPSYKLMGRVVTFDNGNIYFRPFRFRLKTRHLSKLVAYLVSLNGTTRVSIGKFLVTTAWSFFDQTDSKQKCQSYLLRDGTS